MIRKYAVKIDGKERVVEIDEGEVRVDGVAVEVEVVEAEAGLYLLRTEGEQVAVRVEGSGGSLWFRCGGEGKMSWGWGRRWWMRGGRGWSCRSGGWGGGAAVTLRAPIPGRVVKVLVKTGDAVKAGQTLIALEAMKMENELRAPRAGTVTEVRGAEGTAVEAGQELVQRGSLGRCSGRRRSLR